MMAADAANDQPASGGSEYQLCIMRHGIAVPRGAPEYPDDSRRPLTTEGREKAEEIAKGLKRIFEPDWIVSSPLVRAAETARIVAGGLGSNVPVDQSLTLSPGSEPEDLVAYLAKHKNRQRVMVVGHEPDLGELAARFLGAGRRTRLSFKKGGCCLICFDQFPPRSAGELVWWLTPRVMRKLA
jgi:phosphohistidine phosphatase